MKKLLTILCLSSIFFSCSDKGKTEKERMADNPNLEVRFIVNSPDLESERDMYITGGHELLGNWNPEEVSMERLGDHQWQVELEFDKEASLEYKFTLGSWESEAADANGLPLDNFALNLTKDTVITHNINFWRKGEELPVKGQITGTVKYLNQIDGKGLLPRDVVVWLPEEYEANPDKKYPVLYMHDGQNIFDPKTSSFGVDWEVDETATKLIASKEVEPMIIVGVYNTKHRNDEYSPGSKGSAYMDFMVNTLKPLIDIEFRTKSDRANTIVGGSSSGGIISFMLAWEYPDVYSGAICMSPAFKIQHIDYVDDVKAYTGEKKDLKIYVDNGGIGLETELQPGIDDMMQALQEKGYVIDQDLFYVIDKEAKHFESAWGERMPGAMKIFF